MSGLRPLIKGYFLRYARRGARSCLRPSFAEKCIRRPLMLSADPLAQSLSRARTGADRLTGFRINPLPTHHLLVTLNSYAALALGEAGREPCDARYARIAR